MKALAMALILCAALVTAGCGGTPVTYRYKLTLEVETPAGLKRAFNVVDVTHNVTLQGSLIPNINGEALWLEVATGDPSFDPASTGRFRLRKGFCD